MIIFQIVLDLEHLWHLNFLQVNKQIIVLIYFQLASSYEGKAADI